MSNKVTQPTNWFDLFLNIMNVQLDPSASGIWKPEFVYKSKSKKCIACGATRGYPHTKGCPPVSGN